MGVIVGTSGWQYKSWRTGYYQGEAQKHWLEHYAKDFQSVEVNNAFYRLPERSTFEDWATRTPADFIVGVKVSRYLTHMKRLKEPSEPVARFLGRIAGLGTKLGPVLLQLPPNFQVAPKLLAETLDLFPREVRVAVEMRHDSWWTDEVRHILERNNAALSWADSPQRTTPRWQTADWGYLRFHQGTGRPAPCYEPTALRSWAEHLVQTFEPAQDVFVFFNNDPNVCAVRDAGRFGDLTESLGRSCSRRPDPKHIELGSETFEGSIG